MIDILMALLFFFGVAYATYAIDGILTDIRDAWRKHHGRT